MTPVGWQNGRPIQAHSGGKGVVDIVAFPIRKDEDGLRYSSPDVLWLEIKTAKGKQSPEQKSFEEHITSLGMEYLLARSLDDVRTWVQEHR